MSHNKGRKIGKIFFENFPYGIVKSCKFVIVFMVNIEFWVDKLLDQIFVLRFYGQLQITFTVFCFFGLLMLDTKFSKLKIQKMIFRFFFKIWL